MEAFISDLLTLKFALRTDDKTCLKAWVGDSEKNDFTLSCKYSHRFEENGQIWPYFESWEANTSRYSYGEALFSYWWITVPYNHLESESFSVMSDSLWSPGL